MEVENDSKQLGRGYKCLITGEELHEISKSIITSNSSSSSAKKDSALNELENSEKEKDTLSEIKIQDQDERDDER